MRLTDLSADLVASGRDLRDRLGTGMVDLIADPPDCWTADIFTLRIAAAWQGRCVVPADEAQREALGAPHTRLPAVAATPVLEGEPVAVTLGVIARPSEADAVRKMVAALSGPTAREIVVIFDGRGPVPAIPGARVVAAPLDGDFARQRNRVQEAARTNWVLQLDADETLDPASLELLGRLAGAADDQGIVSIGLPRRNMVDGVMSDLFPDVQYRMNRRDVLYVECVHERPDLGGAWRRSMVSPATPIEHRLGRSRVRRRTVLYGAMADGAHRPEDERALLKEFAP